MIRRAWNDKEHTKRSCYYFVEGRHLLPDVIEHFKSLGVDWKMVSINYSATWEDDPTPEEIQADLEQKVRADARQEKWERETLVRLTEKYGKVAS